MENVKQVKKMLLIRLDGLGDTVLMTPLLDAVHQVMPECRIVCLASPMGEQVLREDPRLEAVIVFDLPKASLKDKLALAARIRQENYDVVLCLSEKFWPTFWTFYSGGPLRAGFDPGLSQPLKTIFVKLAFTHRLFSSNNPRLTSGCHEVERYLGLLSLLRGERVPQGALRIFLPEEIQTWADSVMGRISEISDGMIPLCLHISPKWAGAGWGKEFAFTLAKAVFKAIPKAYLVVTAGSDAADILTDNAWSSYKHLSLFTNTSFQQWAALMSRCKLLITMDTGAAHVAAAVGTPVVDVFPETYFAHNTSRWRPWMIPHRLIKRPDISPQTPLREKKQAENLLIGEICASISQLLAEIEI